MKVLQPSSALNLVSWTSLVLVVGVRSHEKESAKDMSLPSPAVAEPTPATTYFQLEDHSLLILTHILFMTIGWVFILPIAVVFSIARSCHALLTQLIFVLLNSIAIVVVVVYNARTPDLYPNNIHHRLGWWLTSVVCIHVVVGVTRRYRGGVTKDVEGSIEEWGSFIPVSITEIAEHQRLPDISEDGYRFSNDSGQGTERNTESLRSQSISSEGTDALLSSDIRCDFENGQMEDGEKGAVAGNGRISHFLSRIYPSLCFARATVVLGVLYSIINRVILLFAFVALTTGAVTYGGLFMGNEVYNGLAHFIKGGVFFWYGILTLGRWAGCFAEIGWAWNLNPSNAQKVYQPSAEFFESFLIFLYGSTNVFLEHLAAWGGEWTAQDLEHVSITIMFFGGGLCGMLIESTRIRDILNTPISQLSTAHSRLEKPPSYKISMNPLPALIILLLGLMMSSHHQHSMISSMIHKQWGTLLAGAALSRTLTYIIFYLAPPTSIFPSRPPTELITAFCLMAGGLIFMASSKDIVAVIESYNLDAMFVFTVAMGIITLLMAWVVLVIAIKGWAVRKERASSFN
ncbi:membrane protein C3B8.06 [Phlyctema vagabunda]|uniref:Membrane protein C3B8.06 n=1 Tax=Phlyctema vagabunda TaxID=108571 RepID=A0ABR4PSB5_9HELO